MGATRGEGKPQPCRGRTEGPRDATPVSVANRWRSPALPRGAESHYPLALNPHNQWRSRVQILISDECGRNHCECGQEFVRWVAPRRRGRIDWAVEEGLSGERCLLSQLTQRAGQRLRPGRLPQRARQGAGMTRLASRTFASRWAMQPPWQLALSDWRSTLQSMWESPGSLWLRLKLGREEYRQRLVTTLIVGGDPPRWNTPSRPPRCLKPHQRSTVSVPPRAGSSPGRSGPRERTMTSTPNHGHEAWKPASRPSPNHLGATVGRGEGHDDRGKLSVLGIPLVDPSSAWLGGYPVSRSAGRPTCSHRDPRSRHTGPRPDRRPGSHRHRFRGLPR